MGVEFGWVSLNDVTSNQFLKTLRNDWSESHWQEIIQAVDGGFFGTGMIVEDFRQDGTVACAKD